MIQSHSEGTVLHLHIQPGASQTEIAGRHGEALKVRIQAPPVDGKANQALLRFLAKSFGIPVSRVQLLRGASGRKKSVLLKGIAPETVQNIPGFS